MTWEAHLFFELIYFLLKKPFHQFQLLFNFHHSFLHGSYHQFLVFLKGKKYIFIWKYCHTEMKTLLVYFPHKMSRERRTTVCLCNRKGGFLMKWSSEHCMGCTCQKNNPIRERIKDKKKRILPVLPSSPQIKQNS